MTDLDRLLDLQRVDTELDQLRHRRDTLPELAQARAAHEALVAWEQRRRSVREQLDDIAKTVRSQEAAASDLDSQRERLQAQLKTVVAPREAEALMREIDELTSKRGAIDDLELEHLETSERLDSELAELVAQEESLREATLESDQILAERAADVDREIEQAQARRGPMRDGMADALLQRYDTLRAHAGGIAVARLDGRRCEACHLELSPAEVDTIKYLPDGEIAECPQCSRMLVR